jgi:hypothetical protein
MAQSVSSVHWAYKDQPNAHSKLPAAHRNPGRLNSVDQVRPAVFDVGVSHCFTAESALACAANSPSTVIVMSFGSGAIMIRIILISSA